MASMQSPNRSEMNMDISNRLTGTGLRTLCVVFLAYALGAPDLGGQGVFEVQPGDATIKSGEAAFVTVETFNRVFQVLVYRVVSPDSPELFGELLSLGNVWALPESERRRYVDEVGVAQYRNGATLMFREGVILETSSFYIYICEIVGGVLGAGNCEKSRTFTIFVEEEDGLTEEAIFSDATELGEGWQSTDWFGSFNTAFFPWIFHAEHNWMYIGEDSDADAMYLYDQVSDQWLYTAAETYPNLYSFGRNSWIFYFEGTSGPREFFDLQTSEFFTIP